MAVASCGQESMAATFGRIAEGMRNWRIQVLAMVSQINFATAPVRMPRIGLVLSNWTPDMRRMLAKIMKGMVGARMAGSVPEISAMPLGMKARLMACHGPMVRVVAMRMAFISGPVIHCWWMRSGVTPAMSAMDAQRYILVLLVLRASVCVFVIVGIVMAKMGS